MRLLPGNFILELANLNKWKCNISLNQEQIKNGLNFGKILCELLLELGLSKDNIRLRDHSKEELSHYSNATTDIEYKYVFGWGELWGIADRTNYDLTVHQEHSKEDLTYFDPKQTKIYSSCN